MHLAVERCLYSNKAGSRTRALLQHVDLVTLSHLAVYLLKTVFKRSAICLSRQPVWRRLVILQVYPRRQPVHLQTIFHLKIVGTRLPSITLNERNIERVQLTQINFIWL